MSILDRYILRKFLGTFFFILALLMAISVIFDISEKIDDFIESDAPLRKIVFNYYLNFVVFYSNLFSSLLVFLAVILFTSRMAGLTEIVAILSSGMSYKRMLRPFMIGAAILTAISLIFNHFVVPVSSKYLNEFIFTYIKTRNSSQLNNIRREYQPGHIVYAEAVSERDFIVFKFSLEQWKDGRLVYKLMSDRANYNENRKKWTIHNYYERYLNEPTDRIERGIYKDTTLTFTISEFNNKTEVATELNSIDLYRFIERERKRSSDKVAEYEVEFHQRTSLPLATFLLTLLGASIASRKVRGGVGMHLASGIGLALLYIFAMRVNVVAATKTGFDPLLAVWIPNFIFAALTALIYNRAPK